MKNYPEMLTHIQSKDYDSYLWNALRGKPTTSKALAPGLDLSASGCPLSTASQDKYAAALKKESLFRNLATTM